MPSKERAGGKELEIKQSISSLSGISLVSFFAYNRKRESNGIRPILVFNVKLGLGKATGSLLNSSTGANLPGFLCSVAILVVTSWDIRWVHFNIKVMSVRLDIENWASCRIGYPCNGNALVSHWTDRKAYDKMVRQIDQAFYGVRPLISDNRDVDDSEMDDRIGNGRWRATSLHSSVLSINESCHASAWSLSERCALSPSLQHPCLSALRAIAFNYS